jgi:hypothetical protein
MLASFFIKTKSHSRTKHRTCLRCPVYPFIQQIPGNFINVPSFLSTVEPSVYILFQSILRSWMLLLRLLPQLNETLYMYIIMLLKHLIEEYVKDVLQIFVHIICKH